ncbi:MAG: type IV pilus secretin family protein [Deltaproteobacteria bacterium]|nr:MAG: type IV pilus secretin family protein [Deltaproteobacteria bacterium]
MCWIRIQVLAIIVFLGLGLWLPFRHGESAYGMTGTAHAASKSTSIQEIESVTVSQYESTLRVTIEGEDPLTYTAFKQVNPLAIIIDIPAVDVSQVVFPTDFDTGIIKAIKGTFLGDRLPAYSRIEITLEKDIPYTVTRMDKGIVIAFQKSPVAAVKEESAPGPDSELKTAKEPDKALETTAGLAAMPPAGGIVDVAVDAPTKGAVKVVISADGILPRSKSFTLPDPSRLVIDIPGIKLLYPKRAVSVQNDLLKKIRMATKADGVRIVFDSKKTALFPYSIDQTAGTITVWIGKQATARLRQESRKPEPVVLPSVGTIEAIDFDLLDEGKVCLTVTADRKLPYKVINVDKTTVLLRLSQALLPKALARPYDTSYFKGAVEGIIPQQSISAKHTVDITIKMRDEVPVPFQTVEKENTIQLEFAATTVPPKPDQLARMAPEVAKLPAKDGAAPDKDTILPPEFSDLSRDVAAPSGDALPRVELPFGPDKVYTGQKISLDFQNADIHNVLRLLAEVSKLNIVAGDDVTGKVTLKLDRVPWDQALDVVLAAKGLGMIRTGNVIRIAPLARVAEENKRLMELQQAEPMVTEYIQVNYGKAEKLKDQIDKIRSERGSVTFDERTNKIVIKDTPTVIENARAIVSSLDEPTRQVLIEARIVEATADFSRELGVQWGGTFSKSGGEWDVGAQGRLANNFAVNTGIPVSPYGALGFTFGRIGSAIVNLDVRLLAMESDGKVHIVSSPKITTLDNKKALIKQGTEIPYRKLTAEGTVTTDTKDAMLLLEVTPHITPDNRIGLAVVVEKKEPDWARTIEGQPSMESRRAETELLINNGETVVIGGIIYEKKSKSVKGVPGLSKIPVLGWLFKGESDLTERRELLIFLSATTVKMD